MSYPTPGAAAFSLVEIVLALSVIAFAIVGIMGLFPVAMRSAQESQRETRSTLIAQRIFSDLRTLTSTNRLVNSGPQLSDTNTLDLSTNTTLYLAFSPEGTPVKAITDSEFSNPYTPTNALFLARVSVDTNTGSSNISRVQTVVETPAAAASTNRSRFTFVTLMNY